jgi:hypothetical protein
MPSRDRVPEACLLATSIAATAVARRPRTGRAVGHVGEALASRDRARRLAVTTAPDASTTSADHAGRAAPSGWPAWAKTILIRSTLCGLTYRRRAGGTGRPPSLWSQPLPALRPRSESGTGADRGSAGGLLGIEIARRPSTPAAVAHKKGPALQGRSRWRDPDSNRGHHDFQSWDQTFSNWPEIPGKQRVLGQVARRSNSSLFAVFCAGIGYPDRTRYPMRAMRSSLPTSERLSSRRCVGMVGTSQHVAGAVGSHSSQCLVHQQCLAG